MVKTKLKFLSWSASRLVDHTLCPHLAMHKHLLKTCPACFKGKLVGGYDRPAVCGVCKAVKATPPAMARGGEIGRSLEDYVTGKVPKPSKEITNKKALQIAASLRRDFKKGKVKVEMMLSFDRDWKLQPEGWTPKIWLIVKLDVWAAESLKLGSVLDWKTGGVNRSTGEIYANEKYGDQLATYQVAGLCAFPQIELVDSALCFVDAKGDPIVSGAPLHRDRLGKEKKRLTELALPMLMDETFAPRPSDKCRWCDYSKAKGGPCPF